MGDLADERISRQIIEGVEGNHLMAETLKCPESIEGRFLEREAGGVQDLHGVLRFLYFALVSGFAGFPVGLSGWHVTE
jgi:hypothetical protein